MIRRQKGGLTRYTLWAANFGTDTARGAAVGDFNHDGKVSGADYTLWAANFQSWPAVGAAVAVPEPSGLTLAALGCAGLAILARRRRS